MKQTQHELLQQLKHHNETSVPDLQTAFFRAAAQGTPTELELLLSIGANINAQSADTGDTPLHIATAHSKTANTQFLLEKGADRKIQNNQKKTPGFYAKNSKDPKLARLLKYTSPNALQAKGTLTLILSMLPLKQLLKYREVSSVWETGVIQIINSLLSTINNTCNFNLTAMELGRFHALPMLLKRGIITYTRHHLTPHTLPFKKLSHALSLSDEERYRQYFPGMQYAYCRATPGRNYNYLNEWGLTSRILLDIKPQLYSDTNEQIQSLTLMLLDNLITHEQYQKKLEAGYRWSSGVKLKQLLCRLGYTALQEELLSLTDVESIPEPWQLFNPQGLSALRQKLLTLKHFKNNSSGYRFYGFKSILSEPILTLLKTNRITADQTPYIPKLTNLADPETVKVIKEKRMSFQDKTERFFDQSCCFISNLAPCRELIDEGFLTLEQFKSLCDQAKWAKTLKPYIPFIKKALEDGLLKSTDFKDIKDSIVLSQLGIDALKEGLLSPYQATTLESIPILHLDDGMNVLRQFPKTLTIENTSNFKSTRSLKTLISQEGLQALKENLITVEQAQTVDSIPILDLEGGLNVLRTFPHKLSITNTARFRCEQAFFALMTKTGLKALEDNLITVEQATRLKWYYNGGQKLEHLLTPTGLAALKEKVITPKQAAQLYNLEHFFGGEYNPYAVIALKYGLITYQEMEYGQKYCPSRNRSSFKRTAEKLVKQHYLTPNGSSKPHNDACIVIQKHTRGVLSRKQIPVFIEIQKKMKTGNRKHLGLLLEANTAAEQFRFNDAKKKLSAIP